MELQQIQVMVNVIGYGPGCIWQFYTSGDYHKDVDTVEFSGHHPFVCQSCHFQIPENYETSTQPLTCLWCSNNFTGMASSQSTRPVHSAEPEDQQFVSSAPDNFTYAIDMPSSPCIDATDGGVMRDVKQTCYPTDESPNMHTEKGGQGSTMMFNNGKHDLQKSMPRCTFEL